MQRPLTASIPGLHLLYYIRFEGIQNQLAVLIKLSRENAHGNHIESLLWQNVVVKGTILEKWEQACVCLAAACGNLQNDIFAQGQRLQNALLIGI
jgi:hypothetical protein